MGADFSNHQLFVGAADPARLRADIVAELKRFMSRNGLEEAANEEDASRSFVVGPAERWVFVGDSAGSTEGLDSDGFDAVSAALSLLSPTVDLKMSDSSAVHFSLYRFGQLADRFGNAAFPFHRFPTEEEAAAYRGQPELWSDLLLSPGLVPALRVAWVQDWNASEILATSADLFGWNRELLWVGYTFDDEGVPQKYDKFLDFNKVERDAFTELHFRRL
jgi:hypothetical protein